MTFHNTVHDMVTLAHEVGHAWHSCVLRPERSYAASYPMTLAETGRVPVTLEGRPVGRINELEWIEGEVFANLWQTDYIVRINPATGAITGIIDLTELMPDRSGLDPTDAVLNGIAWDPVGRRLFVTGKNWPKLFEIRLTGPR